MKHDAQNIVVSPGVAVFFKNNSWDETKTKKDKTSCF